MITKAMTFSYSHKIGCGDPDNFIKKVNAFIASINGVKEVIMQNNTHDGVVSLNYLILY